MTRALIRRSCGHLEAVYAVGPERYRDRRIAASVQVVCRICQDRQRKIVSGEENEEVEVVSFEDSEQLQTREEK